LFYFANKISFRLILGAVSIYQPGKAEAQSEFPRFAGFFAVFMEITLGTVAEWIYML